jgi:hypothetical protein
VHVFYFSMMVLISWAPVVAVLASSLLALLLLALLLLALLSGTGEQDAGYFPPRMSPGAAPLLLYFAAGSTRRPVHLGTLWVNRDQRLLRITITVARYPFSRNKGGGRRPGDIREKGYRVGGIAP